MAENTDDEDLFNVEEHFDEETLIKYYYNKGFSYLELLCFLKKHHGIVMSYRTLLRRLKCYKLHRRQKNVNLHLVQERIKEIINGPGGAAAGYRTIWHSLQLEGMRVPRLIVQRILKDLDPVGSSNRRGHRLRRRMYVNPGPNFSWHIDGYDKLKP